MCITNANKDCDFIMSSCRGKVKLLAMNELGTRVVQRLIERMSRKTILFIYEEVLNSVRELSSDTFGHHVVRAVLQQGTQ